MAHDLMTRCEQRRQYKLNGLYELRWKEISVPEILEAPTRNIRCAYCHGSIRVHRRQVEHGPQDHAEHRSRADSEGCRGGHYFQGEHRMSVKPVV